MTVYSNVIRRGGLFNNRIDEHRAFADGKPRKAEPVSRLNLVLLVLTILVMLGYVFLSNFLTSQKYILGAHKSEFNQISAGLAAEHQGDADSYDLKALAAFAQKSGFIEAKDTSVIWADSNFALSRTNF